MCLCYRDLSVFLFFFSQYAVLHEIVESIHERGLSEFIHLLLKCGYKNGSILSTSLNIN